MQRFDINMLARVISTSAKIVRREVYPSMTRMFIQEEDAQNTGCCYNAPALRIRDIRCIVEDIGDRDEKVTYAALMLIMWLHKQYCADPDSEWEQLLLSIIAEHLPFLRPSSSDYKPPHALKLPFDSPCVQLLAQSFMTLARAAATHVRDTYVVSVYALDASICASYKIVWSWFASGAPTGRTLRGICQFMDPRLAEMLGIQDEVSILNAVFSTVAFQVMLIHLQQKRQFQPKASLCDYTIHGIAAHLNRLATTTATSAADDDMKEMWAECVQTISVQDADRMYVAMQHMNEAIVEFHIEVCNRYTLDTYLEIVGTYKEMREQAAERMRQIKAAAATTA